jgi:hypothetical protein
MNKSLFFLLPALLLITSGCIKDAGPVVVEKRNVGDFESIKLMCAADITITQDNEYELKIQGGEHHLKYIETSVDNKVLEIEESRNRVWNDEPVRIWISADYLHQISILGSGDIDGADFEAEDLDLRIAGSGDMDLSFTCLLFIFHPADDPPRVDFRARRITKKNKPSSPHPPPPHLRPHSLLH